MKIKLKRGQIRKDITDFYFIGIDHYDDFDWFLGFFLQRPDTKLIKRLDGIYSRIAWLDTVEIRYTVYITKILVIIPNYRMVILKKI